MIEFSKMGGGKENMRKKDDKKGAKTYIFHFHSYHQTLGFFLIICFFTTAAPVLFFGGYNFFLSFFLFLFSCFFNHLFLYDGGAGFVFRRLQFLSFFFFIFVFLFFFKCFVLAFNWVFFLSPLSFFMGHFVSL